MDKLTRYNQKLLAIIGTTVLVIAGVAIITGLGGLIITGIGSNSSGQRGLNVVNDTTQLTRTQEVTFHKPHQLDTAKSIFIIPVGQVNLESEKSLRFESGGGIKYSRNDYFYESHIGLFNNFIYYDHSRKFSKKLFDERIAITHWAYLKTDSTEVVLFKGTMSDHNADGRMDDNDYQSLFAFFVSDEELKRYDFQNQTVIGFEPMNKTELVSIRLGVDKDKDFDFEGRNEPMEITALNVSTREINEIVSNDIKTQIQNIIDGIK